MAMPLNRVANTSGGSIRTVGYSSAPGAHDSRQRERPRPASRFIGIIAPRAGKSSLLRVISGWARRRKAWCRSMAKTSTPTTTRAPSASYRRDDIVHAELTVSDALRFSARLAPARGYTAARAAKTHPADHGPARPARHAGKPITRLSGGQRKRVSVGAELLAKPSILFLDEPSSGLDPATEFKLMEVLRDLADTGCTIVCTTHVMENGLPHGPAHHPGRRLPRLQGRPPRRAATSGSTN